MYEIFRRGSTFGESGVNRREGCPGAASEGPSHANSSKRSESDPSGESRSKLSGKEKCQRSSPKWFAKAVPKSAILSDSERSRERATLIPPRIWDEPDSYEKNLQTKFIRTFRLVSRNLGHPSLRVELIRQGRESFYRVRVDPNYRIHLELYDDYYLILAIGPHRLEGIG